MTLGYLYAPPEYRVELASETDPSAKGIEGSRRSRHNMLAVLWQSHRFRVG